PRHERNEDDLPARLLDGAAFVRIQRVQSVIAALNVDVRLNGGEKTGGRPLGEDADAVHALEGSKDGGSVRFAGEGAVRPLQLAYGAIAIEADQQGIALLARGFQVRHMAEVEQVKATIGRN